ncbi:ABC transporter permease [Nocardioides sp. Kera G14]|uniref:ABC transporter permease n=1 Tax=Nocardioides sp. Kera G14 TaxID=2884264 RepID=UPI001D105278|nr:ABC transporter permease [Nocardioides sp. Kera G14]UDY23025.1 ABC transporter permease [Nocardioides sp. Kera G14]
MSRAARDVEGRRVGWVDRRLESAESGAGSRTWYGGLIAALIVLAVWWLASASGQFSEFLLPSPVKVWHAFLQSVTTHDGVKGLSGDYLWVHLGASLKRVLIGLVWATVVGVPLGLLIGLSRVADRILGPAVDFLKALPPLGYFPLLILWFGIEDSSKIWLLFLAAFAPITIATAAGVGNVRHERVNAALVLGAGRFGLIRTVVLPSVAGDIVTGLRLASGFAWTTIVSAETVNGIPGLGGLAWSSQKELRADVAILAVIVIGLTAIAIDAVLRLVERRVAPWRGRA